MPVRVYEFSMNEVITVTARNRASAERKALAMIKERRLLKKRRATIVHHEREEL